MFTINFENCFARIKTCNFNWYFFFLTLSFYWNLRWLWSFNRNLTSWNSFINKVWSENFWNSCGWNIGGICNLKRINNSVILWNNSWWSIFSWRDCLNWDVSFSIYFNWFFAFISDGFEMFSIDLDNWCLGLYWNSFLSCCFNWNTSINCCFDWNFINFIFKVRLVDNWNNSRRYVSVVSNLENIDIFFCCHWYNTFSWSSHSHWNIFGSFNYNWFNSWILDWLVTISIDWYHWMWLYFKVSSVLSSKWLDRDEVISDFKRNLLYSE